MSDKAGKNYWQENLRILAVMLSIWFVVSFLLSIVFVDQLDVIRIGGFGLGFWMAQQGSIFIYVIMIFVYIRLMDKLDRKYKVDEKSLNEKKETLA
jgi:putative solute:sodium symporter small subunit